MKLDFGQVARSSTAARQTRFRRVAIIVLLVLIGTLIFVVRPVSHRSPTTDILGSYFPAWMICIVTGLTLTLVAHWIVQICHLKPYLGPAPLVYSCLMIIFTFAMWILLYQN